MKKGPAQLNLEKSVSIWRRNSVGARLGNIFFKYVWMGGESHTGGGIKDKSFLSSTSLL